MAERTKEAYLAILVTPKAGADAVDGLVPIDGATELKVRVRAIPDEGKANKAACTVVAKFLGVPKSAVSVVSGSTSRHKRLKVVGLLQEDLDKRLGMVE